MPTQWYNQHGPAAIPQSQGSMNQMHHGRFHNGGVVSQGAPMNAGQKQVSYERNAPPMSRPPFTSSHPAPPSQTGAAGPASGYSGQNENSSNGASAIKAPGGDLPRAHFQHVGLHPANGRYPMPGHANGHLVRPNPRGPMMPRHHHMGPHGTLGHNQGNPANIQLQSISNCRGGPPPNRGYGLPHFGGNHTMAQNHHMHHRGPHHNFSPMGGVPPFHGVAGPRRGINYPSHMLAHLENTFQRVPSRSGESSPANVSFDHGALRQTPSPPPVPPTSTATSRSEMETKTSESPAMVERVVSEDSISPTSSERQPNQMEAKTEAASILLQLGSMFKKTDGPGAQGTSTAASVSPPNDVPTNIEESHSCDRSDVTHDSSPDLPSNESNDSADTVASDFPAPFPENYPRRLALDYDDAKLNSLHCYLRSDLLEIFVVEKSQTKSPTHSPGSSVGRVGLRCVHCAIARKQKDDRDEAPMAVFYPKSIAEIYRLVTSWQRCHLRKCRNLPPSVRKQWQALRDTDKSRGKTHYWVTSAKQIGLMDCASRAGGIRFAPSMTSSSPTNVEEKSASASSATAMPLQKDAVMEGQTKEPRDV
eukprot:scaffold1390_cov138-Cylindrotheca_fusiformis.AAC.56